MFLDSGTGDVITRTWRCYGDALRDRTTLALEVKILTSILIPMSNPIILNRTRQLGSYRMPGAIILKRGGVYSLSHRFACFTSFTWNVGINQGTWRCFFSLFYNALCKENKNHCMEALSPFMRRTIYLLTPEIATMTDKKDAWKFQPGEAVI